jgi:hypothetical protein
MRVKKVNPTPEQLSPREYAAVRFIETYRLRQRHAPTYREISTAIGLSLSATHDLTERLIEYGYLKRISKWARKRRDLRILRSVRNEPPGSA